jgi:hypothetical protein
MRSAARALAGGSGIVPSRGRRAPGGSPDAADHAARKAPIRLAEGVARPMLLPRGGRNRRRVDAMPLETVLTLVVVLGLPLWLVAEELVSRFGDKQARSRAAKPSAAASPAKRGHRRPQETSSHVA